MGWLSVGYVFGRVFHYFLGESEATKSEKFEV